MPPFEPGLEALSHSLPGEVIKHTTSRVLPQPLGKSLVGRQAYDRVRNLRGIF